jgi:hypothetical protein
MDWETAEITLTPDPCWTPEAEAAAQSWLDLLRDIQQQEAQGCR